MNLIERLRELDKLETREMKLISQKEKIIDEIKKIRQQKNDLLKFT